MTLEITRRTLTAGLAATALGTLFRGAPARADWPDRPIKLVIGFGPGGTVDTMARILAQGLSPLLGQQVIVDNRPGAGASIAANAVARGPADGYSLLYGVFSHAVAPALMKLPYDTMADLVGVSEVVKVPVFLFAASSTPFSDIKGLIAAAKASPGTITYASGGIGSSAHLAGELLQRRAGISLVHVPYTSGGAALQALLAGDVQLLFDTPQNSTRSFIEGKKMKALTVMASARLPNFPDVPAISEAGLGDGLVVEAWQGVLVKAGTPQPIIDTLHQAIVKVMAMPETLQRVEALSVVPAASDPVAFTSFFRSEVQRWTQVAKDAGVTAQ